jgi:predicted methyltransferase
MKFTTSRFALLAVLALIAASFTTATNAAQDEAALAEQLANAPGRSDEDKARDVHRKPAAVLQFLGLEAGDTVVDVWAAGGWYTEVLSIAVGKDGHVFSQNPPNVLAFREGIYDKELSERLAGGRLANVERVNEALADGPLPPDSVDFAITALNLHDIYNRQGAEATADFMRSVFAVLKPGGIFGVVDHVGVAGADNASLHRMLPEQAREAARAAGFVVEAESDLLLHRDDDHSKNVFDPSLRGETDRFIYRLRKPE